MLPRYLILFAITTAAASTLHAQTPASSVATPLQNPVDAGNGQQATPNPPRGKAAKAPTPAPTPMPAIQPPAGYQIIPFANQPELTPGLLHLAQLEGDFQDAVAKGGGAAFVTFFADDAVILNNGQPAILGRGALAAQATWDPKQYQLTWIVEGAQMGPSGDMGFTWGRLASLTYASNATEGAKPITTAKSRFITIWRKQKDGAWKVAMDASADIP